MWKRLVTGLGVAASLVLAAGCASSALSAAASPSTPVPRSGVSSSATTSGTGVHADGSSGTAPARAAASVRAGRHVRHDQRSTQP